MKPAILICSAVVLVSLFPSCVNTSDKQNITLIDMDEQLACLLRLMERPIDEQNYIISSDEEYQTELGRYANEFCDSNALPYIDFEQYTLLGKYTQGGGCTIEFKTKATQQFNDANIKYAITIVEKGSCAKLAMSMNWALIPKIPDNYTVTFNVTYKRPLL